MRGKRTSKTVVKVGPLNDSAIDFGI